MLLKVCDGQEHLTGIVKDSHQKLEAVVVDHSNMVDLRVKEDERRQASYADILKGSCGDMIKTINSKLDTLPKDQSTPVRPAPSQQIAGIVDSVLDKERRKKNVVVHNLPEATAETHADRMTEDKSTFIQLVRDEFHLNIGASKCFRVGKTVPGKHRLLIVTLELEETKWEIIRLAPQLRHSERWPRVYLSPDLTRAEREEGRKLREELKRRRDNGEENLTIRNHKIVKTEKGPMPTVTTLKPDISCSSGTQRQHQEHRSAQPSSPQRSATGGTHTLQDRDEGKGTAGADTDRHTLVSQSTAVNSGSDVSTASTTTNTEATGTA